MRVAVNWTGTWHSDSLLPSLVWRHPERDQHESHGYKH